MEPLLRGVLDQVPASVLIGALASAAVLLVSIIFLVATSDEDGVSWKAVRLLAWFLAGLAAVASAFAGAAWAVAASVAAGAILAGGTPWFRRRLEKPQQQRRLARDFKRDTHLVVFLRPFALDKATSDIQAVLQRSTHKTYWRPKFSPSPLPMGFFTVRTLALGRDDAHGFPKLETTREAWWKSLEIATGNAVAIFVLPLLADREDMSSGLARELMHVLGVQAGKVIIIMPAAGAMTEVNFAQMWASACHWCASQPFGLELPAYDPAGALLTLQRQPDGTVRPLARYSLGEEGIAAALDAVTAAARQEHKELHRQWKEDFTALNGGVKPEDYYGGTGKKLPPNLPM